MAVTEASSPTYFRHPGPVAVLGRDDERTVVCLRGEHDLSTVAALSATLAQAIALDDADLVLDLSGVEFMGVATVAVITRAIDFLGPRSRSLVLRRPSPSARRILELCGLADLVEPRAVLARV